METYFLGQPFRASADAYQFVTDSLADPDVRTFTVAVAWLRLSGLGYIAPDVSMLRSRNGVARLFVGIDRGGTTHQGLSHAIDLFDEVFVVHDVEGRTFHPKLFVAAASRHAHILIGSQNLTQGGLHFNYEAGVALRLQRKLRNDRRLWDEISTYLSTIEADEAVCRRLDRALLGRLVADGVLGDENDRRSSTAGEDDLSSRRRARTGAFHRSSVEKRRGTRRPTVRLAPGSLGARRRARTAGSRATASWWKHLSDADAQRPTHGNPTGLMRLTKSGHDIDATQFFRRDLFANAAWQITRDQNGNRVELADVEFALVVDGRRRRRQVLAIDHSPHRGGRGRATTILHWGLLLAMLRRTDFRGYYAIIEVLPGGAYQLELTRRPPA